MIKEEYPDVYRCVLSLECSAWFVHISFEASSS
jgi:hypothetical protein